MDLVTSNLVQSFRAEHGFLINEDPATVFEHFVNYCVVSSEYPEEFDVEDIHVGGGNDLQLDGVAIIVNGVLVRSVEEIEDLLTTNRYIDAEFVLIQAKSGKGFDGAEISNFFFGCRELFAEQATLPRNDMLTEKEALIRFVYSKSAHFKSGNPSLSLHFVTTGKWAGDQQLEARIANEIAVLDDLNIFRSPIRFEPVDARGLQSLYNQTQNTLSQTITFSKRLTLPVTENIKEAYLGFLPASEYLSLIRDDNGNLRRGLFYDNVRDFQGENPVNLEIEETLQHGQRTAFVLMNNGVTIVADDLSVTGDKFTLTGFQIVNGCQTSHVLFKNQDLVKDEVHIPIKIVVAPEDELKTEVIKATNRQTVVKPEELSALTDFQKHLEQFYAAIPDQHKLYYERRSQQYRAVPGLEKIRIVTISTQIRAFSSMFLARAHQASRYYGTLLKDVEQQIFRSEHPPIAYYVSAYALFRIEAFLRRGEIDNKYRPFKYHLLHAVRLLAGGKDMPSMSANRFEGYCNRVRDALWDDHRCLEVVEAACAALENAIGGALEKDAAKNSNLPQLVRDQIA